MSETNRRGALATAALATGIAAMVTPATAGAKSRDKTLAMKVDELASRAAVEEVLLDYARGNDHGDEAMIRSCFWPESKHKHGGFDGTSTAFVDFAMKVGATLKYSKHHISNISVRVDGDRAFSECYYFAHHRRSKKDSTGEEDAFFEGRYIDILERRDGVWKIIQRRGTSDWNSPVFPAESPYDSLPAGSHALRSKDDAYYQMLALFTAGKP